MFDTWLAKILKCESGSKKLLRDSEYCTTLSDIASMSVDNAIFAGASAQSHRLSIDTIHESLTRQHHNALIARKQVARSVRPMIEIMPVSLLLLERYFSKVLKLFRRATSLSCFKTPSQTSSKELGLGAIMDHL